jgi:hypothetical protein
MKLDLTSLYFNGKTATPGNTASWGTSVGQSSDYKVNVEGAQELIDVINLNKIEFSTSNINHTSNITKLSEKIILSAAKFDNVYINENKLESPFILLLIEETYGVHKGRKSIKYNNKTKWNEFSNENFYNEIQSYFGKNACWFAYEIEIISKDCIKLNAIKVSDTPQIYKNAEERTIAWTNLLSNKIKEEFKKYLIDVQNIKLESTANEYIKWLPKIIDWFKIKQILSKKYSTWDLNIPYENIDSEIEKIHKEEWKNLNEKNNRWYSSPWNNWKKFIQTKVKKMSNNIITKVENTIYFGAPGTGKSYKVNSIIKNLETKYFERITFHPEFDNASFIGSYKPIKIGKDITYEFSPQAFTEIYKRAWKDEKNQYYLVIEEINRGNCAEIFGDIFQLLDRNSGYTVSPSNELKKYLIQELGDEHEGIIKGLRLPTNLSILATMNTSDQSLFPMDSAFKRRWDWEYIPICYEILTDEGEVNSSFNYNVQIENTISFRWIDFIQSVNEIISSNESLGMDKCMGNYFIKADNESNISLKTFINKAIFYLWNDVFKDEQDSIFDKGVTYEKFFPINTKGKDEVIKILEKLNFKFNTESSKYILE